MPRLRRRQGRLGRIASKAIGCLLLAALQLSIAGYQFGVGNQSIQIPLLRHYANARNFAGDSMVRASADRYPSLFFKLLAPLASAGWVQGGYFTLHVLTSALMFAAAMRLARAMFRRPAQAVVLVIVLLSGHLHALAGEEMYSVGFTHTWLALPVAVWALAWMFEGRYVRAFALAGVLFNVHALTGAYVVVFGLAALMADAAMRRTERARVTAICIATLMLLAAPTLVPILLERQSYGAAWVNLMRIRSGDHLLPSMWWRAGNSDVPRFAMIAALGAVAVSMRMPARTRRASIAMATAAGGLMLIGTIFVEWLPIPIVIRAQLFRTARLIEIIALAHIANGVALSLGMVRARIRSVFTRSFRNCLTAVVHGAIACSIVLTLAMPGMIGMLPASLIVATFGALALRRLSVIQAAIAGAAIFAAVAAARWIHFSLFDLHPNLVNHITAPLPLAVAGIGLAVLLIGGMQRGALRVIDIIASGVIAGAAIALLGMQYGFNERPRDDWAAVQDWTRGNTPADAIIMTPIQPGGFRIGARRSIVGEWRDGTQLFFNAEYQKEWWDEMQSLQPGIALSSDGGRLLSPGRSLDTLSDDQLIALAARFGATLIVTNSGRSRELQRLYGNASYEVFEPRRPTAGVAALPGAVARLFGAPVVGARAEAIAMIVGLAKRAAVPPRDAEEVFLQDVALPNIEKYRKSDAEIEVVDTTGRPVDRLKISIGQTSSDFGFGCSLPFFKEVQGSSFGDFKPPVVRPEELQRFTEIFNFSQIPFSGKWLYIEPIQGMRNYGELDQYVDWCERHHVAMEFHFLSGYLPGWLRPLERRGDRYDQLAAFFMSHATDLVKRYGNRIKYWQVVNESHLLRQSPEVFKAIRAIDPALKLGISDCARFWSPYSGEYRARDMLRGLDQIQWLKQQGVKVDFFAFHGHRPFGLWAAGKDMYEALDAFAREDVKIHISEFTVPQGARIVGPVKADIWTPQLQAEWYERFFTICFSHPAVESINLWGIGPATWQQGSGLLDDQYRPKPSFDRLRDLIREKWTTRLTQTLDAGQASFRGFQGNYELTIGLSTGVEAKSAFSLPPGPMQHLRFELDASRHTLRLISATTEPAQ